MTTDRARQIIREIRSNANVDPLDRAEALMVASEALEAKPDNPMLDALRPFLPIDHPEFRGPSRMRIPGQ